jgi:transcriptional regulator with XRE-family HTH domain
VKLFLADTGDAEMTLVERIKKAAEARGWNLKTTAEKAGIGINSIYRWKDQTPTADSLSKVAKALNVSVDYLLGNEKPKPVPHDIDLKKAMHDNDTVVAWDGKPIPPEEMEMIRRILDGGK